MAKKTSRVEPIDLTRASKFSNEEQKFLKKIFTEVSEEFQVLLGSMIQAKIILKIAQIKVCSYQSYCNSLKEPSCLVIFRMDPENRSLFFMDIPLSFALLDKLMGGKGKSIEEMRYFTEIETAVLKKAFIKVLESISYSFKDFIEVTPQFEALEFNPMGVHIVSPSDNVVVASFQSRIAHGIGTIELCFPFKYLKTVIPKASFDHFLLSRAPEDSGISTGTVAPVFTRNLEAAKIPVSVELGGVEVPFQDILKIEVGDFVKLETPIGELLKVKINNKTKFLGRPGVRDNKISVQVTKVLAEGDEEFEG